MMRSLRAGLLMSGVAESELADMCALGGWLGRRVEVKAGEPALSGTLTAWVELAVDLKSPGFTSGELNSHATAPLPKPGTGESNNCVHLPRELSSRVPFPKPESRI